MKLICLLIIFLFFMPFVSANEKTIIKMHNVNSINSEQFQFGRQDPHIIYSYNSSKLIRDKGLWLTINLEKSKYGQYPAELFWNAETEAFDSINKLEFSLEAGENRLFIPLGLFVNKIKVMRLDIDDCVCQITIKYDDWQFITPEFDDYVPLKIKQLIDTRKGKDIELGQWVGSELKSISLGRFIYAGGDPRVVNKNKLGLKFNNYAGIYFEFDFESTKTFEKFQIFWLLKGLPWSELRSSHFMLPNNGESKKVYIPFSDLNYQRSIEHIRLDFEFCKKCQFVMHNTRLVGIDELSEYESYIPKYLSNTYSGNSENSFFWKQFINKFSNDLWFLVFYLILLLLVVVASFIAIRRG